MNTRGSNNYKDEEILWWGSKEAIKLITEEQEV